MPKRIETPFATGGTRIVIPETEPAGGEVNWNTGWPGNYSLSEPNAAALNVSRAESNQLYFVITEILQQLQETGIMPYEASYVYQVGATVVGSNGVLYRSQVINGPPSAVDPVGDLTGVWNVGPSATPPEHKSGFLFSRQSTSLFTMASGGIADSTRLHPIQLAESLQKNVNLVWSPGPAGGATPAGLFVGRSNEWFKIFAIKNPTTGAVDIGLDELSDASNLLSDAGGFTRFARIGNLRVDGSNQIVDMFQNEIDPDLWQWVIPAAKGQNVLLDTPTAIQFDAEFPEDVRALMVVSYTKGTAGDFFRISSENQTSGASSTNYTLDSPGGTSTTLRSTFEVNGDRQLFFSSDTAGTGSVQMIIDGWYDPCVKQ